MKTGYIIWHPYFILCMSLVLFLSSVYNLIIDAAYLSQYIYAMLISIPIVICQKILFKRNINELVGYILNSKQNQLPKKKLLGLLFPVYLPVILHFLLRLPIIQFELIFQFILYSEYEEIYKKLSLEGR